MFGLIGRSTGTKAEAEPNAEGFGTFITVETNYHYDIVYHSEIKVMYVMSRRVYNRGTFTVLLNADGSPMLYE